MAKTVIIREFGDYTEEGAAVFDLNQMDVKSCLGCWTCWWKTPGVCVHKDIEDFYRAYINADRAVFFAKLEEGFISAKLKRLIDRMIPLFLPYTVFRDGGTFHEKRYAKYPDVVFCYDYDFQDEEDREILHAYIQKLFDQFYAQHIQVRHVLEMENEI